MVSAIQGMGPMMNSGLEPRTRELTSDQQSKISEILSQYDPDNVSEDDAKAIFQAFKDAGITPAKGMKEVIEAAGFDAEELRSMGMKDGNMPPPPMGNRGQGQSINLEVLKSLQQILDQYDLSNLSDTDQTNLFDQLQQSGFFSLGSVVNVES